MKIEHIAIWVENLEIMRMFYMTYFNGKSSTLYHNPIKQFSSYFISFESGCRLELMHKPNIGASIEKEKLCIGITHLAFTVGGKESVHQLTEELRSKGYIVASESRTTGDGYYESVVLDPEGNFIEITE